MLTKKDNSLNEIHCKRKHSLPCTLCKCSTKAVLYVCESGHVICEKCQNNDNNRKDTSDHGITPNNQPSNQLEAIVNYKNNNFKCNSSITSVVTKDNKEIEVKEENIASELKNIIPRPVLCPVTECGKIVANDSVMHHFYFDHSKIPRISLRHSIPEKIVFNISDITEQARCFGIFLLKSNQSFTLPSKNDSPFLLMAARINTAFKDVSNRKAFKKKMCNTYTQTSVAYYTFERSIKYNHIFMSTEDNDCEKTCSKNVKTQFDDNEALLLWICKICDFINTYSITLLRDEKMIGHSYFGEPINIRDKQNARAIYERSECLIVRGRAVNRLTDERKQIVVLVDIIN